MTPPLSERLRDIYDTHIRNIPHSYHSQDLYNYWKEAEALEAKLKNAREWKDNQLERLKDFYDTHHEYLCSQEYADLKELEAALGEDET